MAKLTPKQAAFCREYLTDLCATQAAVRAGYSPATAKQQGSRLLSNVDVAAEIERLMAERAKRTDVTADAVVRELARIGFGDVRQVVEWGPDGVRLKPSRELPPEAAAMVGDVAETAHGVRIKTKPAVRALELLGRHCGIFNDKLTVETPNPYASMSEAELDAEIDRFIADRQAAKRYEADREAKALAPPATPPPAGPESAGDDDPSAAPRDLATDPELADLRRQIDELRAALAAEPVPETDPAADDAWKATAEAGLTAVENREREARSAGGVVDQWRMPRR